MTGSSNMPPGAENDTRSGCHDDTIDCPECLGKTVDCHYCSGSGMVSEREYKEIKELEKEEDQANE